MAREDRRPAIGITGNLGEKGCELTRDYFDSVLRAGGAPLVIPPCADEAVIASTLDRVDGLLLSGGDDINPLLLGQEPLPGLGGVCHERDLGELPLARAAIARQMPVLGICRGIQTLVAVTGGGLYQDLGSEYRDAPLLKHRQQVARDCPSHSVDIEEGSLLAGLLGTARARVNSLHHQAARSAGPGFRVTARAADGVVEAVESACHKSLLGVQWHPESLARHDGSPMRALFEWLTREAASYAAARRAHSAILTLDSHCDTPMKFDLTRPAALDAARFGQGDDGLLVDLRKMEDGMLDCAVLAAYLPQGPRDEASLREAFLRADATLERVAQVVAAHSGRVGLARTPADARRLKREGKKAVMTAVENGYAIGRDLRRIALLRRRGAVYMTLCHNGDNDLCDSARGQGEHGGLSRLGAEAVEEMNRVGMLVDMSHASQASFYGALEASSQPVVCSHSSARALCDHPRNLTDEQMRALARQGGVAQVTLYGGFLRADGRATVLDAVEHIKRATRVMGVEHVGIGSDFDGDGGVPGMAHAGEALNLTRRLLAERYSEDDLRLIWGGNFLRVMEQAQAAARDTETNNTEDESI